MTKKEYQKASEAMKASLDVIEVIARKALEKNQDLNTYLKQNPDEGRIYHWSQGRLSGIKELMAVVG